jgi:hypothetical protein
MSEYSEKMGMAVGNYFKHGYNCAKQSSRPSVLRPACILMTMLSGFVQVWAAAWAMPEMFAVRS